MELNDLFLIPVIDLCNHASDESVKLSPKAIEDGKGKLFTKIKIRWR